MIVTVDTRVGLSVRGSYNKHLESSYVMVRGDVMSKKLWIMSKTTHLRVERVERDQLIGS